MCVEGGIFFKINKRDSTFIRDMRVVDLTVLFYHCQKQYTVQAETGFKSVGFLLIFHIIKDRQTPIW